MSDYEARIKHMPASSTFKYEIDYYRNGKKAYDVSSQYSYASTHWGAKRLARRMLKKLRTGRVAGVVEVIR